MCGKNFKILLFTALLSGFISWSQEGGFTIEFQKQNTQSNSGIIDAYVKITNTSGSTIQGVFETHSSHEDLYLVQRKPKELSITAKDSAFFPVKIIVSSTAKAGNETIIEALFTTSENISKNAFLPVTINERRLIRVFAPEENLIYENVGDSLTIPLHISNSGNTVQTINIVTRYPDFINRELIETSTITVKPFTDTIVNLKKIVTKNILSQEDFNIVITALYQNGDIISISNIKASSIKQDRRYSVQFTPDYYQNFRQSNQVTASTQRNSNGTNSYYLYANAEAEINKSKIFANVDASWWDNSNEMFLRNTWLGYKNEQWGALAGSISKFTDINLVGRGVEAYYNTGNKSKIEAGVLDKSFNLIDYSNDSGGSSAWAGYYHKGGVFQNGYEATLIYDDDSFYRTKSYLVSSRFSVFNKESFSLKAGASLSNISLEADSSDKIGGAGEIIASGKFKNFFYSSSNYLSSGYFAGVKRGVINLNERLNWSLEQYNLWLVYNYLSVSPESFSNQNYFSSQFSTERYSFGVSKRYGPFSLSLSPNLYSEKRTENVYNEGVQDFKMDAARLAVGTTYSSKGNIVSLLMEGGSFKSNVSQQSNNFHFKASFNYTWKVVGLMATYQYNNFSLGEVIANEQLNAIGDIFYNINIMPSLQFSLFKDKLTFYSGFMYSSNTIIDRTVQFTARADYKISSDFTAFANGFYSDISNSPYALNSITVGITKQFRPIKIDRDRSDLEVYVYYENTSKGPLDPLNVPAANQLIIIDGKAFRTNSQGMIKYRSLPPGEYNIRPLNSDGWHAHNRVITINQDTKISIGLSKTSTIKGSISYLGTEKSYEITRKTSGLSIIAVDDSGNVFHTRTDDAGNFVLYVPKGNYTVTLEKAGVSEYVEVENNSQVIQAVPNTIKELQFILNIKEKRVETRKFTSRGFPSMNTEQDKKKKK